MFRFILAFLLSIAALPALALCNGPSFKDMLTDSERAELARMVADTRFGDGLFWQASRDGVTLTIMGTLHLPDRRHDRLLALARPHRDAADLMFVEATQDDQLAIQRYLTDNPETFTLTDGGSLIDRLDPETWTAVSEAAQSRGMPPFMAARFQPWFLTMSLSIPPCAMAAMGSGELGLDNILMDSAPAGLDIRPLEDWRDMLAIMRQGTFAEQLDALRLSLVEPDLLDAVVVAMLDAYFAGAPAESWQINHFTARFVPGLAPDAFAAEFARMEDQLLIARNRNWIPVIEEAAQDHDRIFIAFGAAHLIGDEGVLNLLAQDGWTITRLD